MIYLKIFVFIGERGFEPLTYWSQTSCATKLRYSPNTLFFGWLMGFEPMTTGITIQHSTN